LPGADAKLSLGGVDQSALSIAFEGFEGGAHGFARHADSVAVAD